jgi:hypothetical protein
MASNLPIHFAWSQTMEQTVQNRDWLQKSMIENSPQERASMLADAAQKPDWTTNPVVVRGSDGNFTSLVRDTSGNIQSIERFASTGEPMGAKVSLQRTDSADPSLLRQPQVQEPKLG